jgi:hypothetical protein
VWCEEKWSEPIGDEATGAQAGVLRRDLDAGTRFFEVLHAQDVLVGLAAQKRLH